MCRSNIRRFGSIPWLQLMLHLLLLAEIAAAACTGYQGTFARGNAIFLACAIPQGVSGNVIVTGLSGATVEPDICQQICFEQLNYPFAFLIDSACYCAPADSNNAYSFALSNSCTFCCPGNANAQCGNGGVGAANVYYDPQRPLPTTTSSTVSSTSSSSSSSFESSSSSSISSSTATTSSSTVESTSTSSTSPTSNSSSTSDTGTSTGIFMGSSTSTPAPTASTSVSSGLCIDVEHAFFQSLEQRHLFSGSYSEHTLVNYSSGFNSSRLGFSVAQLDFHSDHCLDRKQSKRKPVAFHLFDNERVYACDPDICFHDTLGSGRDTGVLHHSSSWISTRTSTNGRGS
ncbi:uncharacterized protein CTRU02_210064 [Colletotrichum truncatum]|uniref:Uncharacterized protein n=1 Tax=Colletotrichum truncatum TaxID=5467 RepID=A0ACC3YU83_COLTU